jgi:hypothetical protein
MRYLVIIALTSTLVLFGQVAAACSCFRTSSQDLESNVRDAYENSSVVVLAEATSTKSARRFRLRPMGFDAIQRVQWRVLKSWKGGPREGEFLTSETITECCVCGVHVEKGETRILYLRTYKNFSVSTCSVGHMFRVELEQQMRTLDTIGRNQ